VYSACICSQGRSVRVLSPSLKFVLTCDFRLFIPGGSLDSQTTETQWYDAQFNRNSELSVSSDSHSDSREFAALPLLEFLSHVLWFGLATISQHHLIELQLLKSEPNSPVVPQLPMISPPPMIPPPPSAFLAELPPGGRLELEDILHQEIQKCVYDLIVACGEAGKNGVQAAREELGIELEVNKHQLEAVKRELEAVTARRDLLHNELSQERRWIFVLEETLRKHNIVFPDYPF